jgi:pilus assembly protein CpaC
VIAGLLTEEGARNMDRVAGAAELPVLGALFRSRQFRDRQTELVVFITPRFVEGTAMPAAASAIQSAPMRAPTRLLPEVPTPSPIPPSPDGMPAEVGVAAARPAASWRRSTPQDTGVTPVGPGPDALAAPPVRAPASADAATPVGPLPAARPVAPVADGPVRSVPEGEDRGTAGRWRATRERVRMVD